MLLQQKKKKKLSFKDSDAKLLHICSSSYCVFLSYSSHLLPSGTQLLGHGFLL